MPSMCVLVGICVTQAGLDIALYLRGLWTPDFPACTSHILAGMVANIGQFFFFLHMHLLKPFYLDKVSCSQG